ncbi:MAG: GIY-YIG nuclease family protein [Salegentibacter sp.]
MKLFYVYILECADKSYYTGITSNLEKRISEHNSGIHRDSFTYFRRPVKLKWIETFTDPNHAIALEKQIKGWSRKKKEALIEEDWEKLVEYSRNKFNRSKEDPTQ